MTPDRVMPFHQCGCQGCDTLRVELDTATMAIKRMQSEAMTAINDLENLNAIETALKEALCWLDCHSSIPEAEVLAERLSRETGVPKGPCRACDGKHVHEFKPWRYGPLGRQRSCKTCRMVEHA